MLKLTITGNHKMKLEDYTGAIQDYTKVIELNQNMPVLILTEEMAKDGIKDHKGAIEDYNKAIELNPKNAAAFNNRGISRMK